MGLNALFHSDGGTPDLPQTPHDWTRWVSATSTRNYVLGDPILDWLDAYGFERGFLPDDRHAGYEPRTDFASFVFQQGRRFEQAVMKLIRDAQPRIVTIAHDPAAALDPGRAEATFTAMAEAAPVIEHGVLRDAENRTYGVPDLLVRSDVLANLFPVALSRAEAGVPAPDLPGARWHYRVVDVKFRMLHLLAGGDLDNEGAAAAYKVQLFIYNRALGRLQGLTPSNSYLLGRGWVQGARRSSSCMDRLAPVPHLGVLAARRPIGLEAETSVAWVRRVREEGASWGLLPRPSVPELYPNGGNVQDGPWHHAKTQIASELKDLTMLWQIGSTGRRKGHEAGIYQWTDPRVTPEVLGVTQEKKRNTLAALLEVNTTSDGDPVRPTRISAARDEWHAVPALEFYVDFENVSDLADDFSAMPLKNGQPLIFMIGCGHVEDGAWRFKSFVVNSLAETEEARIIDEWLAHMEATRQALAPCGPTPRLIHWSPAERSNFETAYNSAKQRHARSDWPALPWFDFLGKVMREEPVVVRGALAFDLKSVARAFHGHGCIQSVWGDGPADGLGAMVGAWWCDRESRTARKPMTEVDLMQDILRYNEVDCKVMMEIVAHLRQHH